jgi:hypothetical protein
MTWSKSISEDLNNFVLTVLLKDRTEVNEVSDFLLNSLEKYSKLSHPRLDLFSDDVFFDSFQNLTSLFEYISDLDSESKLQIKISVSKSDTTLDIFEPKCFFNKNSLQEKFNQWHTVTQKYKDIRFLSVDGLLIKVPIRPIESIKAQSTAFNNIDNSPIYYSTLSEEFSDEPAIKNELILVTGFCFLKNTCSAYTNKNDESFTFEGYSNFTVSNIEHSELIKCHSIFINIYDWLLEDKHTISKLGIFRNVISLSRDNSLTHCFNNELMNALFSNFVIYLKENINQYFDVKNKVSEFIFELSNKCSDILEQYTTNARNILLGILSYFFTVIIFTIIDKNNTIDKLFSLELGGLSCLFIIAGILLVRNSKNDLDDRSYELVEKMKEIKSRYQFTLSRSEIDEMFNSPSINSSMKRIKDSKLHANIEYILYLILVFIIFLVIKTYV